MVFCSVFVSVSVLLKLSVDVFVTVEFLSIGSLRPKQLLMKASLKYINVSDFGNLLIFY